jgi:hypothetical protein
MAEFDWAANNLDAATPQELQGRGVNVYFAPQIAPERRVVNLADGTVAQFEENQDRPSSGLFADYEGLERYCRREGIPLVETGGQISVLPSTTRAAGDPLAHGEAVPPTPNPGALVAEPMGDHPDPDPAGARGGDTGPAEQVGYGEGAERGDQHREYRGSEPQTRGGKAGGTSGKGGHRSGSQSGGGR